MTSDTLKLQEVDNVIIEHIRASLLKIIVRNQGSPSVAYVEESLKYLVEQLDGLQIAHDISQRQELLPLEPVNVLEVTENTIQKLNLQDFINEIHLRNEVRNKEPVLAHRNSLIRSLDSMLRAAVDFAESEQPISLTISTKKIGDRLRMGVFSDAITVNAQELQNFNSFYGRSRRPSSNMSASTAAHLFVINNLAEAMGINFRTAINSRSKGLALILPFSTQLQLISI